MIILYKARATAGGQPGKVRTDDGALSVDLADAGAGHSGVNPEQLFAAAYAAGFARALRTAAAALKLAPTGTTTAVEVGIGQAAGGGWALDVDVAVELAGIAEDEARRLIEAADRICAYSHALRGNVDVRLHVTAR
jgi:Ohr subfamily peroxiredoxin